jgi:quinoprotein glucose dehydrogenase
LRANIGPFTPRGYYSTSPPAVTRELVIISGHVADNESTNEPSGVTRAFDVHDGHLVWNWDAGNPDDTQPIAPGRTYVRNSPNMWSVFSVDEKLGMVYLPLGNQTPDQWGGLRTPASEKVAAGVVALDLATGKLRWNYQLAHHDLWDMDVGGQPTLVDLQTESGVQPALIASTKQGSIYVLNRETGKPIAPVTERPVPQGAAPGDHTSPTQPFSALNFAPPTLRERDMWGTNPFDQLWCRIKFKSLRYDGMFTPPSEQGSLVFPGNFGVFDWGGIAVDPVRHVLLANPSYMAFTSRLVPRSQIPSNNGEKKGSETSGINLALGTPFGFELRAFLSPLGIPCQSPPWGYVAGVDLRTMGIVWEHKNGTDRDSAPLPIPLPLGVPSLGGMMTTGGGVAFLSGTLDYYLRAYDVRTGERLWQDRLPAGGQATPMTYADSNGKQYVLVTAGGHGSLGTKQGDFVIAYTLR